MRIKSYFSQRGQADSAFVHVVNFAAISTTAASVADILPRDLSILASIVTIVWMSLQIWDTPRVQKFIAWITKHKQNPDQEDH